MRPQGIISAIACLNRLTIAAPCEVNSLLDPTGDKLGAVASENSLCTQIGVDLLKSGGNAADAMTGTVFCVGMVAMYHSGIGGGGFMIVRSSNGSYEFIDFRETAPAAAFEDMYKNDVNASIYGGLASGVPGELRGLERLHTNYGVLPWADVIAPAIKLGRFGFRVTEDLVNYMEEATEGVDNFLVRDPSFAIDFAPNGTLVKLNDTIYRKRYADTLETIAQFGPHAFYTGAIANATINALQARNGTMTLDDLKNYTVAIRKPAQIRYRDYLLTGCSAPSGGTVALSTLKTVEGYPDFGHEDSINISTYRLNEAMRFAYGERANLGDPSFVSGLQSYEDSMLSSSAAAEIRRKITSRTHTTSYYDPSGLESLETPGTSEIVSADASGLAISLTTTVNLLFGNQIMVPSTGVILNNEMNDFSIPGSSNSFGYVPSESNYIRPGKRPLSSITPVIAEHFSNRSFFLATGAAGGSRIITSTIQNIWHVLDQNMTIAQALKMPRFHDQLEPDTAQFEYEYDNGTTAFLRDRGVNVTFVKKGDSAAQGLTLRGGRFEAAGEPRQLDSAGIVV